ncbi:hypothetical protein Desti_5355 [Desulfomonile tiedjei DSM 6799]|uniref:Uncharacterized protein n=1 Tax=Desulfomonile tiedjei (strain ATCC 49306 / DSM 6799 / DCB-1) TaxID=706587 RepID=I4CEF2_DESTA|nr:hypothetical protein Desti_5355 [Desulfomonile tiedjei DSM 6799]
MRLQQAGQGHGASEKWIDDLAHLPKTCDYFLVGLILMCVQRSNPATGGSKSGPGMPPERSQAVPFVAKGIWRDRQITGFSIFVL